MRGLRAVNLGRPDHWQRVVANCSGKVGAKLNRAKVGDGPSDSAPLDEGKLWSDLAPAFVRWSAPESDPPHRRIVGWKAARRRV
jgi:hypothetical protein